VKAPHRRVTQEFFWGDDSDLLERALQEVNKQFAKSQRNLLVIHPRLRWSIFPELQRTPIERALVGEGGILPASVQCRLGMLSPNFASIIIAAVALAIQ
jgi:hypothetical protein